MPTLLFIDTNILLDFYRAGGQKETLSILSHIDSNHDKIITGSQVEMEFMKNRQKVIVSCLTAFKGLDGGAAAPPAFLSHSQAAGGIKKARGDIQQRVKTLTRSALTCLENPSTHDYIYKVCRRLFRNNGPLNLCRDKPEKLRVRRLAQKRFFLGYPPRKDSDSSYGDAINWEWIVQCAKTTNSDVVIASRDSDYGVIHDKKAILNDWLRQEFKERVGRLRKVHMTDKLSTALKMADISVTRRELSDEQKLLASIGNLYSSPEYRDTVQRVMANYSQAMQGVDSQWLINLLRSKAPS